MGKNLDNSRKNGIMTSVFNLKKRLDEVSFPKPDQREGDLVQVPYLRREAAASERPAVSGTGHAVTGG